MKKFLVISFLFVLLAPSCQKNYTNYMEVDEIEHIIITNTDSEFGYCDVSQYHLTSDFNPLSGLIEAKICVSNDSSNFNEYGIFKFSTPDDAQKAVSQIKNYLKKTKKDFESGIIYDIEEYPKFENADTILYGNYVIYTILKKDEKEKIFSEIKNYSKKGIQMYPFIY